MCCDVVGFVLAPGCSFQTQSVCSFFLSFFLLKLRSQGERELAHITSDYNTIFDLLFILSSFEYDESIRVCSALLLKQKLRDDFHTLEHNVQRQIKHHVFSIATIPHAIASHVTRRIFAQVVPILLAFDSLVS